MNMKSMSMYSTQYLVGAPFAWITAAMRRGMESISLWNCSGVMRASFNQYLNHNWKQDLKYALLYE